MRFSSFLPAVFFLAISAVALQSTAVAVQAATPEVARCERDVHQYVQAMRFIRQTSGNEASSKFMAKYVSETEVEKLSAETGPCNASKLLRQKGLL